MPVYVVAQGRIENQKMLDEYVAKVIPTIQSGGGRIILPLRTKSTPGTLIVVNGLPSQ